MVLMKLYQLDCLHFLLCIKPLAEFDRRPVLNQSSMAISTNFTFRVPWFKACKVHKNPHVLRLTLIRFFLLIVQVGTPCS